MSEKKRRGPKKKFRVRKAEDIPLPIESNEYLSFIAGYTSGGAAYGLTWEEYNPNDQEKYPNPENIKAQIPKR